jgi:hypothetical protein
MSSPTTTPIPSHQGLPVEIQREIYGYVALDEESWIGVPSTLDARLAKRASENATASQGHEKINLNEFLRSCLMRSYQDDRITERPSPIAFVNTTSGLVGTCSQIRDELRDYLRWKCIHRLRPDEYVEIHVRDFCVGDFKAFLDSRSIFEMMRLSEKRRAPRRNKLRIHLELEHIFPLWTPSSATPEFLVAGTVFLGNGLAALLECLWMSAVIPKRLLELRDIAQQVRAKNWKCSMKTAVLARGAFAAQKPLGEWMAFVRRTGLRADYVVDEPTERSKIAMFDHAMRDKRLYARDDAWTSLHGAVLKSCAGESRYDRVC